MRPPLLQLRVIPPAVRRLSELILPHMIRTGHHTVRGRAHVRGRRGSPHSHRVHGITARFGAGRGQGHHVQPGHGKVAHVGGHPGDGIARVLLLALLSVQQTVALLSVQ